MTTQLNTSNYTQLNTDTKALFQTGLYSGVAVSVYTDEAGTTPYTCDDNTQIVNKKLIKAQKVNSYIDPNTQQPVKPKVCLEFDDRHCCNCIDDDDNLWYKLEGIPIQRRRF